LTEKQSKESKKGGKRPGAGRPKGTLDKGNALIREMACKALENLGGSSYFEDVARTHPAAFLSLLAKILPTQITGGDGNNLKLLVEFIKSES
jgi:hypothetical protein